LGLSTFSVSCESPVARSIATLISAQATPKALTIQQGTTSTFTIAVQCDLLIDTITVSFSPSPLPVGMAVSVVGPTSLGNDMYHCSPARPGEQFGTQSLTLQVGVAGSAPLGSVSIVVSLAGSGGETDGQTIGVGIDVSVVASAFGRNLLVNPDFSAPVVNGTLPTAPGGWQGDLAASVGAESGINPRSVPSMLRFDATGTVTSTNTFASQQWQIVDVSAQAADIAAGRVLADASAWFNRVAGDASTTDTRFDIRLLAFGGTAAALPAAYTAGSQFAVQAASILSTDNNWQQATVAMTLPTSTTLLLVEIYAFEDKVNDGTVPEFAGHYADDISLVLTRQ
jgi:hypothetical protein